MSGLNEKELVDNLKEYYSDLKLQSKVPHEDRFMENLKKKGTSAFWIKPTWKKVILVGGASIVLGIGIINTNSSYVQAITNSILSKITPYYELLIKNGEYAFEKRDEEEAKEMEKSYREIEHTSVTYKNVSDAEKGTKLSLKLPSYQPKSTELISITGAKDMPFTATVRYKTVLSDRTVNWNIMTDGRRLTYSQPDNIVNEKIQKGDVVIYVGKSPRYHFDESKQEPQVDAINTVWWLDKEGIYYNMFGELPIEEMKKIAESMVVE